ncbi:hypothetical protein G7B40_001130 [Aetokthonos hydrillicola Thurmond2011]|uniref:Uncharacterized protein n=1 Tax=Aetokthonos hydrillicola Thurmond2011 TaxID=2712845 RepID=A0AAP5I4Y7_9CYAN|nr:hypothetical protein [Aetokthonos hydrillicola CCALA 1050]MBW4589586.1 hypothetical protein [Aetokthonos hydrillicola CCALA 1050]MDR9893188.1 hypothetical protein [Aetokthonos hydrillicola Thurmond2011]
MIVSRVGANYELHDNTMQNQAFISYLLRCTFCNAYTARLSESEENVHLSYVASGDRR